MADETRTETLLSADAAPGRAWKDVLPRQFGRYRVLARLGSGGMGVVYEGHDPKLDRVVAIKVGLRSRAHDIERFVREARAMAALQHPSVVALYDFGFEDEAPYLVLEKVRSQSLGAIFDRFDSQRRRTMLREAGEGLRAAHLADIVHRDVKPDNILIGHSGRARLTDFGLAAFQAADSTTNPVGPGTSQTAAGVGTLAYMSPEQHVGDVATSRSDVFSFCVSVVEVLTGRRPFAGSTSIEMLDAKKKGPPRDALQEVPRRLRSVLLQGLEPDPDARGIRLEEILRALEPPAPTGPLMIFGVGVLGSSTIALVAMTPSAPPCAPTTRPNWTMRDRAAVLRVQSSHAGAPMADRVAGKLDVWVAEWETAYARSCGEDAPRRHAWRHCLLDQASAFESARERVASGTSTGTRALSAADSLPTPSTCAQRAGTVSAADLAIAAEARRTRGLAADARRRGQPEASAERLRQVLAMVRSIGHIETRARETALIGNGLALSGAPVEGRLALVVAMAEPDQPPELEVASALALAWIEGLDLGDLDAGFSWLAHAQAIQARASLPLHLQGKLLSHEAALRKQRGEYDQAVTALQRARTLLDRPEADDRARRRLMTVEFNLGALSFALGRFDEAAIAFENNAASKATELGSEHPEVADALTAAFRSFLEGGRLDEAEVVIDRAIGIYAGARGADHPSLASIYRHRSELSYARTDVDEAVEFLRKAVSILPKAEMPRLTYEADLATALFDQGRLDEAEVLAISVLQTTESASDPEFATARASSLRCLAEVYRGRGNLPDALLAIRRAQTAGIKTTVYGKNSMLLLTTEAEILVGMGDADAAVALLIPQEEAATQGASSQGAALLAVLAGARGQSKTIGTSGSSK